MTARRKTDRSTAEISISHLHNHHCLSVVQTTPALSLDTFLLFIFGTFCASHTCPTIRLPMLFIRHESHCYLSTPPSIKPIRQSVNAFETSPSPYSVLYIRIVSEYRTIQAIMFFFRHTCQIIDELHVASRGWTRINPDVHTDMAPAARLSSTHPCNYIHRLVGVCGRQSVYLAYIE